MTSQDDKRLVRRRSTRCTRNGDLDKVVQRVTMRGRHTGPPMGREPGGRAFAVRRVYVWRIAGGRIAEHWGSRDDLCMLALLGLLPDMPPEVSAPRSPR